MCSVPQITGADAPPLPDEILNVMEEIAEGVHKMWAQKRLDEGWQYGLAYDGERKLHPCLVPYDRLPESEKEYDRSTAARTIQALLQMGFTIRLPQDKNA